MTRRVPIFAIDINGSHTSVGDLIICERNQSYFSERTPQTLIDQFNDKGLSLPRYIALQGLWSKFWSWLKGETIHVRANNQYFPQALDYHNMNILRQSALMTEIHTPTDP